MNLNDDTKLNSDLLRSFLAVAETGNVTRAASVLGRTQSAISVQIRKLEQTLSTRLFERQARGMALTEDGRTLLPAARTALAELGRIGDLFSNPLTGRIRIGIPDDYGIPVLERVLANFSTRHPGVEVFVRCGFSVDFPQAIRRNELDLAVYTAKLSENIGKRLFSEPTVWAAKSDFPLQPGEPVPLALFDRQCWWRDAAVDALKDAGRPYRIAYTSESVAGIKAAIGAGLAIGALSASTLDSTMRILTSKDGFPPLPSSSLVLLHGETAAADIAGAMETAIREVVRPPA